MSHHAMPHDTHIVEPRSGLLNRAWHFFFDSIGRHLTEAAQVAEVTAPDASDLATVVTLANQLKARVNSLTTALGRE